MQSPQTPLWIVKQSRTSIFTNLFIEEFPEDCNLVSKKMVVPTLLLPERADLEIQLLSGVRKATKKRKSHLLYVW
jgi:hypothetical protein